MQQSQKAISIIGCLLGTAIGDAFGLPYEGLSKQRQKKLYPNPKNHNFIFNKGMISDDTEHTCMVGQSLIVSAGNTSIFTKQLAFRLKFWMLGLPAGIGSATLKSIIKLWLGFPPHKSGVFSAGNGAAMRSTIIGVCYGDDIQKLKELVRASTRLTHSDIKAEYGALAVALAAYLSTQKLVISPQVYYEKLEILIGLEQVEFLSLIKQACDSAELQENTQSFAAKIGLSKGITGYIYHTVPVVIQTWLRYQQDYKTAILEIVCCGGDTDTTAAILGGIIGASVGKDGIPQKWLDNLWEYPRNIKWMEFLAIRLAEVCQHNTKQSSLPLPVYGIFLRNILFLLIVIFHGFRRLFPPY
ncbi:ADP-ribosylation/crystallin J1 [Calothrix parasitica NIES-267]|uniref:ADP-ribosylation/crystallin J1 n=1 Tax=Calothrix parasitica NIES-267 TaxID=1973488 RepID=A0A1Z4LPW7_9CYAN|nr:ADP-ribosylation/crystallin J1 [Calothrix parasitica NIES-267]